MFVNVPTERNKAQGSYQCTQPILTVSDSCLVFYSVLWAHEEGAGLQVLKCADDTPVLKR